MDEFNEDLLQEYLDGMLDDKTRQAVEAYLASSPAARAQLAELQALFSSLDALPELPVTRDLSAAVVAEIGRETAESTPRWLWGLLLGQVAIALLLLGDVWASLLDWLGSGRQLAVSWINSGQLPNLPNLTIDLPTSQWALLFGLALIVWLAGNRLLFTPD